MFRWLVVDDEVDSGVVFVASLTGEKLQPLAISDVIIIVIKYFIFSMLRNARDARLQGQGLMAKIRHSGKVNKVKWVKYYGRKSEYNDASQGTQEAASGSMV